MIRSEEVICVDVIWQSLVSAMSRQVINAKEATECRDFVRNLIEERDALRSIVVRQETALTQLVRGGDADIPGG